ncbi:MAG: hypothetical protein K0R23_1777 [Lacrimispora sp.]|nr:hypothetical protein [Lacrimispora sp.]
MDERGGGMKGEGLEEGNPQGPSGRKIVKQFFYQMGSVRSIEKGIDPPSETNEFISEGGSIPFSILLIAGPCLRTSYTLVSIPNLWYLSDHFSASL